MLLKELSHRLRPLKHIEPILKIPAETGIFKIVKSATIQLATYRALNKSKEFRLIIILPKCQQAAPAQKVFVSVSDLLRPCPA
jgi:hypothetical protein